MEAWRTVCVVVVSKARYTSRILFSDKGRYDAKQNI
jgi:hypothetical protein